MKGKAKITISVDCYDDHNEMVREESHESTYVFNSWQQAQTTYELSKGLIQERQGREQDRLDQRSLLRQNLTLETRKTRNTDATD